MRDDWYGWWQGPRPNYVQGEFVAISVHNQCTDNAIRFLRDTLNRALDNGELEHAARMAQRLARVLKARQLLDEARRLVNG